jgi:hypothetical protein
MKRIAKRQELFRLLEKLVSFHLLQEGIYFLKVQDNDLIAKVSQAHSDSVIEEFEEYDNIYFFETIGFSSKDSRQRIF